MHRVVSTSLNFVFESKLDNYWFLKKNSFSNLNKRNKRISFVM